MAIPRAERNIGIDLLRVFSIMMVVVGHAGTFPNDELLTIWRMPLFFIISGFFYTPGRSLYTEFTRRWDTLVIPYLAWSVIISVWLITVLWGDEQAILDHLESGWTGGSQQSIFWMAAWFITTLAGATILRRFLERYGTVVVWAVAILGMVVTEWADRLVKDGVVDTHFLVDTPLRLGLAWPVMFYLLIGELLRKLLLPLVRRFPSHLLAIIGVLLVVSALTITANTNVRAHYIQAGDFGTPLLTPLIAIVITIGFILVFATWINDSLKTLRWARASVSRLVRTGTPVVFFHGLVIVWMHQNGFGEDSLEHFWLRLIVAVTVSFAVGLLINSTPAARLLSGAPQEPNIFRPRQES
jgi:fucose 4-O-acetylase-like acetyltransferase